MLQQASRLSDAQFHVVALRRGTQLFFEQALQLAAGTAGVDGELIEFQGFFEVGVHQLHHLAQRRADTDVFGGFDAAVARLFERQDIFDAFDQGFAMQALDPVQGHMESPRGAGRGEAVAVDHVGFAGDLRRLGHFGQRRAMFGVDGTAVTLQQPRTPEEPRAVPQTGEAHARFTRTAQPLDKWLAGLEFGAKTTADHQQVQVLQARQRQVRIRANDQAQVADDFALTPAEGARSEQIGAQQVGGHQRVEGLGKGRQGEVFEQQKTDTGDRGRLLGIITEVAQVLALHATAELASFHRGSAHAYCCAVGAILGANAVAVSGDAQGG